MKTLIALVALSLSTAAFASGSFDCKTLDGTVAVSGGQSSAGTWVQNVSIDGVALERDVTFTAEQLYVGKTVFHFTIMDGEYNRTLLQAETVSNGEISAGLVKTEAGESKVLTCEFLY